MHTIESLSIIELERRRRELGAPKDIEQAIMLHGMNRRIDEIDREHHEVRFGAPTPDRARIEKLEEELEDAESRERIATRDAEAAEDRLAAAEKVIERLEEQLAAKAKA